MSIFVIGINHTTASVAVREKVYFSLDKLSLYLQDILTQGLAREALLLSTCNRSELYCESDDIDLIQNWFCTQSLVSRAELDAVLYIYRDQEAVAHIMQVACGLDSMVLGEPQILGQVKEAFSESCSAGAVGTLFHRLFQQVFTLAKEIRTSTAIGACPVSVASAATRFVRQQVPVFEQANIVLIGAGDTSQLLLRYLKGQLAKPVAIVNRSREKAALMTTGLEGRVFDLDQMALALSDADIVFSATGSAIPIVTESVVRAAMDKRPDRPLIMVDIAVPRDIEPEVANIPHVYLFCIDDLKEMIEKNRQGREHAAQKAYELIAKKSSEFITELKSIHKAAHTIRAYRQQIEAICYAELVKAKQQLHRGNTPTDVLENFAHALTKKLLHTPSSQLRHAGATGHAELLRVAKQLFALPDSENEWL